MAMTPDEFQQELDKQDAEKQQNDSKQAEVGAINKAGIKNVEATNRNTESTAKGLKNVKGIVTVDNPDLAKSGDVASAVDAIHKLNMTTFSTNQGLPQLADNLVKLSQAVQGLQKDYEGKGLPALSKQLSAVIAQLQNVSKTLGNTKISVDSNLQKTIDSLQKSISGIDFKPTVNVTAPAAKIVQTPVNLQPIIEGLGNVEKAINESEQPEPTDLAPVIQGLDEVRSAISNLTFPVPNYVLPFKDVNGRATQVQLDASGNLPITASISGADGAILDGANSAIRASVLDLTNTNPLTVAITDGSGNQITSFGGTGGTSSSFASTFPSTGTAIGATDGTNMQPLKVDGSDNLLVKVNAALPAGTNVIGHVITDTGSTTAVTGTVTVSGTVTANAGTNLNTSALALETGGNLAAIKADTDKIPSQGQALAAASMPVVLTAAQITTLTPLSTVAATQSGTWNITNVSGTVSLPTGASTETTLAKLPVAQASTTSGQSGPLVQGAVTTSAPIYTTAQTSPLSLTTGGLLRVDASGTTVPISASSLPLPTGAATSANQTNASQKTQIVDGSGNIIASTSNALNVAITSGGGSGGTSSTFGSAFPSTGTAIGQSDGTNMVAFRGDTTNGTFVNVKTSVLPTGAASAAKQPALGTAGTASADVITVQGIASMTKLLVTPDSVALPANQSVNVSQINGVTPLMGNGTTGTGSQRVTIASDNTAFSVNATLSAETTKVIGTVNQGTSPWVIGQSTASNLNATVVQGTAAAVTAGWPMIGGELADTTGTFTNATQTTSVTTSSFDGYSTVIVSISGTYGTATGVFEISDDAGTTWYSVNAARTDGSAVETGYTSLTNTNRMWTLSVSGADEFRVRSTAVASGTANIRISVESMPTPEAASVTIPGTVAVTQSGTWSDTVTQATAANLNATVVGTGTFATQLTGTTNNINNITGTISLPTGAATAANQSTEITSLASIASATHAEDAANSSGDVGVFALGVRNDTIADSTNTNGDYTQLSTDVKGHIMTANAPRLLKVQQQTTITSSTAETTVLTAVASTFLDVYGLIVTNSSATATDISFKDATAGTTRFHLYVPAGDTRGFMLSMDAAHSQAVVNNNWTATCGTSVASIQVTILAVKNI